MVYNLDFRKLGKISPKGLINLIALFFKEGKPKDELGIYSLLKIEDKNNYQDVWWVRYSLDTIKEENRVITQTYLGRIKNLI